MPLNCFFGLEVGPETHGEVPIPEGCNLVITQLAIARGSENGGPVTMLVSVPKAPNFAICTLDPRSGIFQFATDLVFHPRQRPRFSFDKRSAKASPETRIHITGYYEADDDMDEDKHDNFLESTDEDEDDVEDEEEGSEEEEPTRKRGRAGGAHGQTKRRK